MNTMVRMTNYWRYCTCSK